MFRWIFQGKRHLWKIPFYTLVVIYSFILFPLTEPHCTKIIHIWNFPGPYFPIFKLNTAIYFVNPCIRSKGEKIRIRKIPNTDTFHAVPSCLLFISVIQKSSLFLLMILLLILNTSSLLTKSRPLFWSYRNQQVHLQCRSIGWFLYDGNIVNFLFLLFPLLTENELFPQPLLGILHIPSIWVFKRINYATLCWEVRNSLFLYCCQSFYPLLRVKKFIIIFVLLSIFCELDKSFNPKSTK